jgi:hypothetical protein
MTETASRQRLIAIWALRAAKLTGSLHTVQTFAAIAWGQCFRYLTGLIDYKERCLCSCRGGPVTERYC